MLWGDPGHEEHLLYIRRLHPSLLYVLKAVQLLAARVQICPVVLVIRTGWERLSGQEN